MSARHRLGDPADLSSRYQKMLAGVNKAPWVHATGEDFRVRGVEGGTPTAMNRFMHRYMVRVLELATVDASVRLALLEVFNLVAPPTSILRPRISAKVLRRTITRRSGASIPPTMGRRLPNPA